MAVTTTVVTMEEDEVGHALSIMPLEHWSLCISRQNKTNICAIFVDQQGAAHAMHAVLFQHPLRLGMCLRPSNEP